MNILSNMLPKTQRKKKVGSGTEGNCEVSDMDVEGVSCGAAEVLMPPPTERRLRHTKSEQL